MSERIDENQEILDNPLIVHKKSDASYKEGFVQIAMNETHEEEDGPTLQRHRFRKDPNKSNKKGLMVIPFVLVIVAAVFCALYFTGNLGTNKNETTTDAQTTEESTTSIQEAYANTIVIKDTYIFVDGEEVDGITGLQDALKYVDASENAFKIILENPNSDFYNFDVLELLTQQGFYGKKTEVEYVTRTGLVAAAEQALEETVEETTQQSTTQVL